MKNNFLTSDVISGNDPEKASSFRKKNLKKYFLSFSAVFMIGFILCFFLFFITKKTFIWDKDGYSQHYRAYIFYHRYLLDIFDSIVKHHKFIFPEYNLHVGLGSDILQTFHYYVIGDPLTFFCVFVPEKYMSVFYSVLLPVRLFLAGLSFSVLGLYLAEENNRVLNIKSLDISERSRRKSKIPYAGVLCASSVYMFCGFVFYAVVRHPYFANPMILFPMVILGIIKIADFRKPYLFIFSVFLSAVSNFYFFYMTAILAAVFAVVFFADRFKLFSADYFKMIFKTFCFFVLGTLIAMPIFLPQVYAMLSSSRMGNHISAGFISSLSSYESQIASLVSVEDYGSNWTFAGISFICFIAAAVMFSQKGFRTLKTLFIVSTAMIFIPKCSQFMNGMSYPANRWIFSYVLLLAVILMYMWNSFFDMNYREKRSAVLFSIIFAFVCFIMKGTAHTGVFFAVIIGLAVLTVFALAEKPTPAISALIICLVLAGCAGESFVLFNPFGRTGYLAQMKSYSESVLKKHEGETEAVWRTSHKKKNDFFRYEGESSLIPRNENRAFLSGLYSMQYYWSLENGNISQMRYENGIQDNILVYRYGTMQARTVLSELAGVKYYIGGKKLYGYSDPVNFSKKNDPEKIYPVCTNKNPLPFGYTYENAIKRSFYKKLPSDVKQQAFLKGAVVDDRYAKNTIEPKLSNKTVPMKIVSTKNVTLLKNNKIKAGDNAEITIETNTPQKSENETYLVISDLKYRPLKKRDLISEKEWKKKSVSEKAKIIYSDMHANGTSLQSGLSFELTSPSELRHAYTPVYTKKFMYYRKIKDRVISFGVTKGGKETIKIRFDQRGLYTFKNVKIRKMSMKGYSADVNALKKDTMKNIDFHESPKSFSTDRITGKIRCTKDRYLVMNVPYSSGWTCYIDGKKTDLIKANTFYSSVFLKKGKHSIEMKYETPGLKSGLIMAFCGLALVFLYSMYPMLCMFKKQKQKY